MHHPGMPLATGSSRAGSFRDIHKAPPAPDARARAHVPGIKWSLGTDTFWDYRSAMSLLKEYWALWPRKLFCENTFNFSIKKRKPGGDG